MPKCSIWPVCLGLILAHHVAYCQYSNVAHYAGQGGAVSTGSTYQSFSSVRQDIATGMSQATNLTHYSGFMSAFIMAPAADADGDGLADEDDPDNDNDGLSDEEELLGTAFDQGIATLVNDPDSDDDGMEDGHEAIAGTDPTNDMSFFAISYIETVPAGAEVTITIPTVSGRVYQVTYSDGLLPEPGWTAFVSNGLWTEDRPPPTTHTFFDDFTTSSSGSSPSNDFRFYRINVARP